MVDSGRDAAGYTPGQIKALKIAIAIMTFAIVAGLAVLVVTIAYRATNHKLDALAVPGRAGVQAYYPGAGPVAEVPLPPGGHVTSVTPWGEVLVLVVESREGSSVLVLDPKTGKVDPIARLKPAP